MANFFIEKETTDLQIEYFFLKEVLSRTKYINTYKEINIDEINETNINGIHVGTIPFVTRWLNTTHNINRMNPIEVPKYLRTYEFLNRDYTILDADNIPTKGKFFLKDVSELKKFSFCGEVSNLLTTEIWDKPTKEFDPTLRLSKEHKYLISEVYDILSEYRVYVIQGKIEAIANYNGNPLIYLDTKLVDKMVKLINYNEKWLKSYTLDVMVSEKGTALIEIHNFVSIGLYNTLWGNNIIQAYKDGINYVLNDNREIEV